MRLAKLSLAAIVALGVSAFADVENVKFGGDAKLYYGTTDADYDMDGNKIKDSGLFSKKTSYGQVAADIYATADLANGVKGKLEYTALATLGLENNLVSATWAGSEIGTQARGWVSEAWLAKTFGNTTLKVGRQELDTPLAFSEKWNIAENTFDAAVLLNNDLPQTTLVAAWVGKGNGANGAVVTGKNFYTYGSAILNEYDLADKMSAKGAYAFAAITKLIPNTTAQVWYYNVRRIADAWWLQADVNLDPVAPGLTFGAQYAYLDPSKPLENAAGTNLDASKAWAVKLGYAIDALKLAAAYSSVDKDGAVVLANTATGAAVGSQSKLYTEAWWNYGYVGVPDADSWMLSAEYKMEGIADFYAQYTNVDTGKNDIDMNEFTLTASKSFGNLGVTLAYIYTEADDQNFQDTNANGEYDAGVDKKGDSYNTVQVYLTYNF